jgi:hypothetical protein
MPTLCQTTCVLPYYAPLPLTELPLILNPEHLFPYTSYGDTLTDSVQREFRLLVLENDVVRVGVCPDLGGRVLSYFNKTTGKELLFANSVVKPVRILPVWAFISGGIEFNFPIAHSPTSIDPVGFSTGAIGTPDGEYAFIRVGEREARTGMEWVVELGLLGNSPILIQRTALRNETARDHPWMMWTNCAVPSTPETEFVYPEGPALRHDRRLSDITWPQDGSNWERNITQMTGFFWKPGSGNTFGVYHHDAGSGLLHIADPAQVPGKKLWTYGFGDDRSWAQASTDGLTGYSEIQSGPLEDQNQKPPFPRGGEVRFEEYWMPVTAREDFDRAALPSFPLPAWSGETPWLGHAHSAWQCEWEAFLNDAGPLPQSTVPPGLELEDALRGANANESLALWLIARNRCHEALALVKDDPQPSAQRIAGLICWKALDNSAAAVIHLESGPLHDPIAVVELDELLHALGRHDQRAELLEAAPEHLRIMERRASLALATGRPEETLEWLLRTSWPMEHQRYVRSNLWREACHQFGRDPAIPGVLGEDQLARFGAYWSGDSCG